jgi:predicted nucleic acid-binding protein
MAAPWAYIDTSVLMKRYVKEVDTSWAVGLLRRHRVLSSAIAPLEAVSALARRQAVGDLTRRDFTATVARLAQDRAYWGLVEVTSDILDRAEGLVRRGDLRTLDAIHLASALSFGEETGLHVAFVTADQRQGEAARLAGLRVLSPG